ncbi:hypothetical protein KTE49_16650 [Burkholderia multivorans]|uniref:hypothetical protein n=1 Tax=Burkholderia multivorans TaxID=87883 RepID=UPI000D008044|nr:hypothetical protein [Burkholderia multivorans]MBJ9618421.1 hypothetical protein [Burkholderia multivorans]MBU9329440.1 hypothetical protein [Burkholderia multivorans]MBU9456791.1 hypothetical protein [Burkholderia multivorans]MBU9532066.1 hypothetical protein [Burkholderia multivorans]MDR8783860.1 hypothetical protein [Burkholderia multivorans]
MIKTLAVCTALGIAAVALPRFHEPVASRPASAHRLAADTERVGLRHAEVAESARAPASSDADAGLQAAAAQGDDKPRVVTLGVANAGWSNLFNH